jgi:OmpA-OmpF porin, OOP family
MHSPSRPIHRVILIASVLPILLTPHAVAAHKKAPATTAAIGTGKEYRGRRGQKIFFPLGDASFADEVVLFQMGHPGPIEEAQDPHAALGPPDRIRNGDRKEVTLGCGGVLTLRFVDNALVDVDGPDLYIFELGGDVEPTTLSISSDGNHWIDVGKISGGTAEVDIAGTTKTGELFHYIRLTDLKTGCGGQYPGADIDAVGAIGAGVHISLSSAVLFDTGKYALKPEAKQELDRAEEQIRAYPGARVMIEGHTDNAGSSASNSKLSSDRAAAVRDYLASAISDAKFETAGYGETRPISSNDTDEGRQKNRRVDIVIIPASQKQ